MSFPQDYKKNIPDTIVASLTYEARGLLARAKLGDVVYRILGWQLGYDGYQDDDPVKIKAITDQATESVVVLPSGWLGGAVGYIEVLNNTFQQGDAIILNGKYYYCDVGAGGDWIPGSDEASTVQNIIEKVKDTAAPEHNKIVALDVDPSNPNRIRITSLIAGEIGNSYPISVVNVGTLNFLVTPMSEGVSATLLEQAYPTPTLAPLNPALAPFISPDGDMELIRVRVSQGTGLEYSSTLSGVSLLTRVPDGTTGYGNSPSVNAYGELAVWVEVLDSNFAEEIGRKVLYAIAHFPISCKSDRQILVKRIVIGF